MLGLINRGWLLNPRCAILVAKCSVHSLTGSSKPIGICSTPDPPQYEGSGASG